MMLHLEAGTCVSSVDLEEINWLASECYQAQNHKSDNSEFDYECPTCQTLFTFISGLLQHAVVTATDRWKEKALSAFFFALPDHASFEPCTRLCLSIFGT